MYQVCICPDKQCPIHGEPVPQHMVDNTTAQRAVEAYKRRLVEKLKVGEPIHPAAKLVEKPETGLLKESLTSFPMNV